MRHLAFVLALGVAALPVAADSPTIDWTWRPVPDSAEPGKAEFERSCSICHGAGPDRPGTNSLQIKYEGKVPALLEERTDLSADLIRYYVRNGFAMMPRFRKTELSDAQVDAIARYLTRTR
jgi:mono/diheme cytochrome c family protein